jgi:hypothetical protein
MELRTSQSRNSEALLSDLALDLCPPGWLRRTFPAFQKKRPGFVLNALDGLVNGGSSNNAPMCALAFALVFDSSKKAISALAEAS